MMRKQSFLLIFLLLPFILLSQVRYSKDFKVSSGEPFKHIDADKKLYFTTEGKNVFSVKIKGETVELQAFDAMRMREIYRNSYEDFPKNSNMQAVVELGGKWHYFFEVYNRKKDNSTFYYRTIDPLTAQFGETRELLTTKDDIAATMEDPFEVGYISFPGATLGSKFKLQTSFDKTKLLITYRNKPKKKNDDDSKDIIGLYVFDSKLIKQWGYEVEMPYTEAVMDNMAYSVSGNGNAYILIHNKQRKIYSVLMLNEAGNLKETSLDIGRNLYVQKIESVETSDGNIVFAGFYGNKPKVSISFSGFNSSLIMKGIFYFGISSNGSILELKKIPFTRELINKYLGTKGIDRAEMNERKGKGGIEHLQMTNFFGGEDGSLYFVGEQRFYGSSVNYTPSGQRTDSQRNYFNSIIVAKVSGDGLLDWIDKIPKSQNTKYVRGSLGFEYIKSGGMHFFLFLDNIKNANISVNDVPAQFIYSTGARGLLTAYVVNDKTGESERHNILLIQKGFENRNMFEFKTSSIFNIDENALMFEVYIKKKKDMMVKLELQQ